MSELESGRGIVTVTTNHAATGEPIELSTDLTDSVDEMVEAFGAEVVYSYAKIGMRTAFRNRLFSLAHKGAKNKEGVNGPVPTADAADAIAKMEDWKPSLAAIRTAKDPEAAIADKISKLEGPAKQAKIDQIRAMIARLEAAADGDEA